MYYYSASAWNYFTFTPPTSGTYRFEDVRVSGSYTYPHETRLFDSGFNQISGGYTFDAGSFALTGGSVYYIMLSQRVYDTETADSVLLVWAA